MFLWSDLQLSPLVYVLIALIAILIIKSRRRAPGNIPPFPFRPFPLLGHIPMLTSNRVKKFRKWRKSAGDIYSLYLGSQLLVVFESLAVVKEAFVKHADIFSDRPLNYMTKLFPTTGLGIFHSSGANWKEQRTSTVSILKDFGIGKAFLDEKVNKEIDVYMQELLDLKGKPTDLLILNSMSVSNVMCGVLFGDRFQYDDPYFKRLIELVHERILLLGNLPIMNALPWLRYLPGDIFGHKRILTNSQNFKTLVGTRYVKEPTGEEKTVKNFINSYYQMRNMKRQAGVPTKLDDDNLLMVILNLFVGSSETTTTMVQWCILFAIHNPDAQQKVFNEVADVVGMDRIPSGQDQQHMPYTIAYVNEALRYVAVAPLTLPHLCSKDVNISGYTIPKGSLVVANLDGILNDESKWGDPFAFRPERFLKNGQIQPMPEEFLPFSVGRRYCIGAYLAKLELFLFITRIIQRFEIQAEDPKNLPSMEIRFGLTSAPHPFKVRLIERK